jgi:hypothetical protein
MSCAPLHSTDDETAGLFYGGILRALNEDGIPFLLAGTYAFERHAGYSRGTKDLDLFILESDWPRVVDAMARIGVPAALTFSHWLGKAGSEDRFVDFVFAGGNGRVRVTPDWFTHAHPAMVKGEPVLICAAEELIWSKSFVMERERYDGADVLHAIRMSGATLDWERLLQRFGAEWPVLLSHLILFEFVYPDVADTIPSWVKEELIARYRAPKEPADRVCRGPLLSRSQYLVDITEWGYRDPRLVPEGNMTHEEIAVWTEAAFREATGSRDPGPADAHAR